MASKSEEDEDVSVVASPPEELQTIVERANATGDSATWCDKQPAARRNDIFGDPEEFRERSQSALPPHLRTDRTQDYHSQL